jgi:hypothetical protein
VGSSAHRALLTAIRAAILEDPWFEGWGGLAAPSSGTAAGGGAAGPALLLEDFDWEPWASLTYSGALHHFELRLDGPMETVERAQDRLQALFAAGDLPLAGQFLADFAIGEQLGEIREDGSMRLSIRLEALTLAA